MAQGFRKAMVMLGLADECVAEDSYEGHDSVGDVSAGGLEPSDDGYDATVTPLRPQASVPATGGESELRRITTVHPRSYNDARIIGDAFRDGTPVIMNLTDMSDADAKRLVDFSAGLIFGLNGAIERVTSKVFLLSPEHVEVTDEEGRAAAAAAPGFFNQS